MLTPSFNIENEINEVQNQRLGYLISGVLHLLLLLLFWLIPLLSPKSDPPHFSGILVSLGQLDQGEGDDLPELQNENPEEVITEETPPEEVIEEKVEEPEVKPEPVKAPEAKAVKAVEETVSKKQKTSELEETIKVKTAEKEQKAKAAIEKQRQLEKQRQEAEKLEAKRVEQAKLEAAKKEKARKAAEAKRKAEEAARKKAEFEARKKQFGEVIGKGKGRTGKAGNEGDPNGDPSAEKLKGISTGKGEAGDGLGDRGILFEPTITDNSQKVGKVAIRLCVDKAGNVSNARFTQKGSTTTDTQLIQIALINVKKYKFTKSEMPEQCGNITIDFKLR